MKKEDDKSVDPALLLAKAGIKKEQDRDSLADGSCSSEQVDSQDESTSSEAATEIVEQPQ